MHFYKKICLIVISLIIIFINNISQILFSYINASTIPTFLIRIRIKKLQNFKKLEEKSKGAVF